MKKETNSKKHQQDHELCGYGAGCGSSLMMPEGIIAVGLTGDDSNGIGAKSGGADGTAPMVLTRQRQCHPGPAGIGWRGKGRKPRCKTKFCYTSFTAEFSGAAIFETVPLRRPQDRSTNGFKKLTEILLSDRETQLHAAAGADRNAPRRFRGMIGAALKLCGSWSGNAEHIIGGE